LPENYVRTDCEHLFRGDFIIFGCIFGFFRENINRSVLCFEFVDLWEKDLLEGKSRSWLDEIAIEADKSIDECLCGVEQVIVTFLDNVVDDFGGLHSHDLDVTS
jgi:hypothetical protein